MQQQAMTSGNFDACAQAVAAALERVNAKRVVVGMRVGHSAAYMLKERGSSVRMDVPEQRIITGCLTKLFTGELVRQSMSKGLLGSDDPIANLLATASDSQGAPLAGVTIRHLLDHTHGLDGYALREVPRRTDGCIDARELLRLLSSAGRLSEPGALHSYGDVGAWLLAAILERIHGVAYEQILMRDLFEPLAMRLEKVSGAAGGGARICPATGGAMALSIGDLLAFFGGYVCCDRSDTFLAESTADGHVDATPMPGWCQFESGIYRGWKCFGPGWFGHNTRAPGYTVVLRVQPRQQVAIMVASEDAFASGIVARLFGDWIPHLRGVHIPALLCDTEALESHPEEYVGTYANAASQVSISGLDARKLEIAARQQAPNAVPGAVLLKANLRPAQQHVFFTQPPNSSEFPFVQFISGEGGRFTHLWNGKTLWRRQERAAPRHEAPPMAFAIDGPYRQGRNCLDKRSGDQP